MKIIINGFGIKIKLDLKIKQPTHLYLLERIKEH